ncbi:MAG: hypothetical protein F6J98_41525 [Moorea sp. SIO4G2]|uniref:hypothetical protein n=1 Tax=Moorena sp. SIO4A5 TaxID=2607838 RepID=UPI0013C8A0F7|nr:hypothetical protein [Moorena sp. SIO4A5]NEO24033.1 hypothetical protein [Moorena sp. SIO4A5]NEO48144.1 hypothetical protein [Moorena sp. SIO4A3]NEO66512.1 hypothetical protein [Moorena sp. SIO4G2]
MLKPFHPDGEAHPYQETVEQASVEQASVEQASSLCPTNRLEACSTLIMDRGILIPPFYPYTRHFSQWRICHLILRLALYFWSSPAITVLACEQDLETLAVEEAL